MSYGFLTINTIGRYSLHITELLTIYFISGVAVKFANAAFGSPPIGLLGSRSCWDCTACSPPLNVRGILFACSNQPPGWQKLEMRLSPVSWLCDRTGTSPLQLLFPCCLHLISRRCKAHKRAEHRDLHALHLLHDTRHKRSLCKEIIAGKGKDSLSADVCRLCTCSLHLTHKLGVRCDPVITL